jgi:hypothetical protein
MWVAVELIILPIMLITTIVVLGVVQSFGFGTIAISAVVLTTIYVLVRWLLRLLLRLEHDDGVESWVEPVSAHDTVVADTVVAKMPGMAAPGAASEASRTQQPPENMLDEIDECGDESFPASDPPSWTLGRTSP